MKQKIDDKPVTEKKLKEIFKNYPTKEDLSKSFDAFRKEQDFQHEQTRQQVSAYITQFSDRIFTAIDPLLKELETRQQDREISAYQAKETEERHDDLEKRVSKLERS